MKKVLGSLCLLYNHSRTVCTVLPHVRPAGIIISHCRQMRVLLENTTVSRHKIVRDEGIIRIARIIQGRVLYEEIWYIYMYYFKFLNLIYS